MDLDPLQTTVVSVVLDHEHVSGDAEIFAGALELEEAWYRTAVAQIVPDEDLRVVFTLPSEARPIFITVTDGDVATVRLILSNLEEMVRSGVCFHAPEVVRFDNEALKASGVAGVAILPMAVSAILHSLGETLQHQGELYRFHLVAFVSCEEVEIWKTHGGDYLMEYFDKIEKDLLTFNQT